VKSAMVDNFKSMPGLLKLLTASSIAPVAFCLNTLIPHATVVVFGQRIATSEWWRSGAGFATLLVGILTGCSTILMLRRSKHARLICVSALIAIGASAPAVIHMLGNPMPPSLLVSLTVNSILTALIALYLYRNQEVSRYFAVDDL
jgi:hypothetical protein